MNGRGTLHRQERERPTSNGVCCFTVMGIGAVNRNLGIIVDYLTSFIPIGQLGLETSRVCDINVVSVVYFSKTNKRGFNYNT